MHLLLLTNWLTAHKVAAQAVSAPVARPPAALVEPAAQAVHTLELTYSLIAHEVVSQVDVAPALVVRSPTTLVEPRAQEVHVPAVAGSAPFVAT